MTETRIRLRVARAFLHLFMIPDMPADGRSEIAATSVSGLEREKERMLNYALLSIDGFTTTLQPFPPTYYLSSLSKTPVAYAWNFQAAPEQIHATHSGHGSGWEGSKTQI